MESVFEVVLKGGEWEDFMSLKKTKVLVDICERKYGVCECWDGCASV